MKRRIRGFKRIMLAAALGAAAVYYHQELPRLANQLIESASSYLGGLARKIPLGPSPEITIDDVALKGSENDEDLLGLYKLSKTGTFDLFKATHLEPQVIRDIGNSDKNLPTKVLMALKIYPNISELELERVVRILNKKPEIFGIEDPFGDYLKTVNLLPGERLPLSLLAFGDRDSTHLQARIKTIITADGRKLNIDDFIEGTNKLNSQGKGLEGSISFYRQGTYIAEIEVGDGIETSIGEIKFKVEPRDFLSQRDHLFNRIAQRLNYGARNGRYGNLNLQLTSFKANGGTSLEDTVCNNMGLTDYRVTPELSEIIWNSLERNISTLLRVPKLRESLVTTFERASEFEDIIHRASCESGLPKSVIYGWLATESAANSRGNSSANAKGAAMFIASTAIERGLEINHFTDQRYDPEKAIIEGAKLMAEHINNYGLVMGMSAYNAGPGTASRILRKYKGKIGVDAFKGLPGETENYFSRFLSRALIYQHRDVLHLNLGQRPLYTKIRDSSIIHVVKPGENLNGIANRYGVDLRPLLRLNHFKNANLIPLDFPLLIPTKILNSSVFYGK